MKVRPLRDRVLIKRIDEQETVRGGIIIPDTAKKKSQEGEVIAVGTGKRLENGSVEDLEVKAGDRIFFGKYSGKYPIPRFHFQSCDRTVHEHLARPNGYDFAFLRFLFSS